MQRFNGLNSADKLLKIRKYKGKILERVDDFTEEAGPNDFDSVDFSRYLNFDKAEEKLPKAILKIEQLLENFSQLEDAATLESKGENIAVGTQKIIQEVLDNVTGILQKHRMIYRNGANGALSQFYRGAKHLALSVGARMAMRILKNQIDKFIEKDKSSMSAELRGAVLAKASSVTRQAFDERLHLYASVAESYRLVAWYLQGAIHLTQLTSDFGMTEPINHSNPHALVDMANELQGVLREDDNRGY